MIVAAIKWVAHGDLGMSDSDAAALEVALRLDDVTVATVGPAAAERGLKDALAAGAQRAIRIDAPADLSSSAVAAAMAPVCVPATWVICGDASRDRGSGSVPGFLAAELGIGQALGLVAVERTAVDGRRLRLVRRLDGGRPEVLVASSPTVLSVEGSVARLRRSFLPAELKAQRTAITVIGGPDGPVDRPRTVRPFRPRSRELPTPTGGADERIRSLTDVGATSAGRSIAITLEPAAAAAKIMTTLQAWGYVGASS